MKDFLKSKKDFLKSQCTWFDIVDSLKMVCMICTSQEDHAKH